MWTIVPNIEINNEIRDINEVDCYMRTIGILINSINRKKYDRFVFFSSLYKCYGCFHKIERTSDWYFNIYFLAAQRAGIKLMDHSCSSGILLKKHIRMMINHKNPPMVPLNLKYIFYSEYYLKKDAIKLFLIAGYNDSLNLFEIVDNLHNIGQVDLNHYQESNQYTSFVLPENILIYAWQMCDGYEYGFWDRKLICVQDDSGGKTDFSLKEEIGKITLSKERPMEFREIYSAQILIDHLKGKTQKEILKDDIHYNSVLKAKKTILLMILNDLKESLTETEIKMLETSVYEILKLWERFRNLIYYRFYKGDEVNSIYDFRYVFEPIIDKEIELFSRIKISMK